MKKCFLLLFPFFSCILTIAQNARRTIDREISVQSLDSTHSIFGSLSTPEDSINISLAIIIPGSGPVDRNGNSVFANNDHLIKLAQSLDVAGIATFRYDKLGVGKSIQGVKPEQDLRFEDYVNDAKALVHYFKSLKKYRDVVVIGHSEGALIGLLAASEADKYVSLEGAARSALEVIRQQISKQPDDIKKASFPIIDSLEASITVQNVPSYLMSVFRPSVQPYLLSWSRYNPVKEISKLKIPILVVQGSKDLQVPLDDASMLSDANALAQKVVIADMNHIFREIAGNQPENLASYNNLQLPISRTLVECLVRFIRTP